MHLEESGIEQGLEGGLTGGVGNGRVYDDIPAALCIGEEGSEGDLPSAVGSASPCPPNIPLCIPTLLVSSSRPAQISMG